MSDGTGLMADDGRWAPLEDCGQRRAWRQVPEVFQGLRMSQTGSGTLFLTQKNIFGKKKFFTEIEISALKYVLFNTYFRDEIWGSQHAFYTKTCGPFTDLALNP